MSDLVRVRGGCPGRVNLYRSDLAQPS
jgi:hypothetical protein